MIIHPIHDELCRVSIDLRYRVQTFACVWRTLGSLCLKFYLFMFVIECSLNLTIANWENRTIVLTLIIWTHVENINFAWGYVLRHKAIAKPLGRSVRLRNKIRKFIKTCCNTVYLKLKYNSCLISFSTAILISIEKNGNFKISFCTFELSLYFGQWMGANLAPAGMFETHWMAVKHFQKWSHPNWLLCSKIILARGKIIWHSWDLRWTRLECTRHNAVWRLRNDCKNVWKRIKIALTVPWEQ